MITTRRSSSLVRLDLSILPSSTLEQNNNHNSFYNAATTPMSPAALAHWNLAPPPTSTTTVIDHSNEDGVSIVGVSEIDDDDDDDRDIKGPSSACRSDDDADIKGASSACRSLGPLLPPSKYDDDGNDEDDEEWERKNNSASVVTLTSDRVPQVPSYTKEEEEEDAEGEEENEEIEKENEDVEGILEMDGEKESLNGNEKQAEDKIVPSSPPPSLSPPPSASPSPLPSIVVMDSFTGNFVPMDGQIHAFQNDWMEGTARVRYVNGASAELVVDWQISFAHIPPSSELFAGYEAQLEGSGKKVLSPQGKLRQDPTCHVSSYKTGSSSSKAVLRRRRSSRNESVVESAPKESDGTTHCFGWKATNFMKTITKEGQGTSPSVATKVDDFDAAEVYKMSCNLCQRKNANQKEEEEWHFSQFPKGADLSPKMGRDNEVHFVLYWAPTTAVEGSQKKKKSSVKAWKSLRLPKKSSLSSPKGLPDKMKILDWKLKLT